MPDQAKFRIFIIRPDQKIDPVGISFSLHSNTHSLNLTRTVIVDQIEVEMIDPNIRKFVMSKKKTNRAEEHHVHLQASEVV